MVPTLVLIQIHETRYFECFQCQKINPLIKKRAVSATSGRPYTSKTLLAVEIEIEQ